MSAIRIIRLTGMVALAVIVIAMWMVIVSRQFEPTELPGRFQNRVMAMEFVDSVPSVGLILGPDVQHNREVMRKVLLLDFIWIGSYALLYFMVGWLLSRRHCPWAAYLATVAVVSGLAGAVFDIKENRAILMILEGSEVTQSMVNSVRDAALVKWTLSFVAMAILATAFYGLTKKASWIGYTFTLTAVIGLAGLWYHPWIGVAAIPMLLGLLALSLISFVWPQDLKEPYC
ncbi:MAG: hypothetical protein M3539_14015 [Acidobacteriota bacterium]|nr:hypothetical protein [Acidobacteriota bacterium]